MAPLLRFWLLLLLIIPLVFSAPDLSKKLEPEGELGVTLDYSFTQVKGVKRNWIYTGHITFNEDVSSIRDGQLRSIGEKALDEMKAAMAQYNIDPEKLTPKVMTVLAVGREIILASSQKGSNPFAYTWKPSPVFDTLMRCQLAFHGEENTDVKQYGHANRAACGEVLSAHLWYTSHQGEKLGDVGGRILAMEWLNFEDKSDYAPKDPCPNPSDRQPDVSKLWGCSKFVKAEGLTVVPSNTVAEDYGTLDDLAGGVAAIDQIELACGPPPDSSEPKPPKKPPGKKPPMKEERALL